MPKDVHSILGKVSDIVKERGTQRDLIEGERTMSKCVHTFNALTDLNLTEQQGWIFMMILKLCRMQRGSFKEDDYLDTIGYSALLAESAIDQETKDYVIEGDRDGV